MARTAPWLLLGAPALFLGLFFGFPLWRILAEGLHSSEAAAAWRWLTTEYVTERIVVAFEQAVWSVLLTLALALPLAWHHHRKRLPFSRAHLAIHAAPFVLPVFVVVFAVRETLGPHGLSKAWFEVDVLAWGGPMLAVVLAHAYYNYGFAARLLHEALERRPHRLEAAARTLGSSPRSAFLRVTLPLLWPSMLAVALLVFLFSFTSFGVVLFLGGREVATLETMLYRELQGFYPRHARAAVLGLVQLAINVALLGGYLLLRRKNAQLPREPQPDKAAARTQDHVLQWSALALGLLPVLSVFVGALRVRGEWTLEAWRALLDSTHPQHLYGFDVWHALERSLTYAAWTTVLSLGLTLLLAYGLRGLGAVPRRIVETVAALPLGTSSLLIGLGFVFSFGATGLIDMRGSSVLIVLAHALVAFPFTARALLPALEQHDHRLDDTAALLGAGPGHVVRRIHWPLLRGPVLVAAGFAVALSLGDFGASALLMETDNASLSVWIARHDVPFRSLMQAQAIALSSVLMVLAAAAYLVVERFRTGEGTP
jgi:thiamine transport system permease protein